MATAAVSVCYMWGEFRLVATRPNPHYRGPRTSLRATAIERWTGGSQRNVQRYPKCAHSATGASKVAPEVRSRAESAAACRPSSPRPDRERPLSGRRTSLQPMTNSCGELKAVVNDRVRSPPRGCSFTTRVNPASSFVKRSEGIRRRYGNRARLLIVFLLSQPGVTSSGDRVRRVTDLPLCHRHIHGALTSRLAGGQHDHGGNGRRRMQVSSLR